MTYVDKRARARRDGGALNIENGLGCGAKDHYPPQVVLIPGFRPTSCQKFQSRRDLPYEYTMSIIATP